MKQNDINITVMTKDRVKKNTNCKRPGPDGAEGYWLKKLITLDERIANG